tara:strand:+ start:183 stop:611 length:429 start_codon:yes stop_codon:yes gene_type:complete
VSQGLFFVIDPFDLCHLLAISHPVPLTDISLQQSTAQLIESLNTHRVNTLTELCRIERVAATASEEDQLAFQEPMTSAWTYYVTSNNLLNELRGLTRNYTFSSECLDDAKWKVSNDPESNRSWNYAWLVLIKMRDEQVILLC